MQTSALEQEVDASAQLNYVVYVRIDGEYDVTLRVSISLKLTCCGFVLHRALI
jgi:hypothetical protein